MSKDYFEEYKMINWFVNKRPLKKWINKTNYSNLFEVSWDELFKVIDAIEEIETSNGHYEVRIHIEETIIVDDHFNKFIEEDGGERKGNTYRACVEFIKWYNEIESEEYID